MAIKNSKFQSVLPACFPYRQPSIPEIGCWGFFSMGRGRKGVKLALNKGKEKEESKYNRINK